MFFRFIIAESTSISIIKNMSLTLSKPADNGEHIYRIQVRVTVTQTMGQSDRPAWILQAKKFP